MKTVVYLPDLTCANCGSKIEAALGKLPFIQSSVLNFPLKKLSLESAEPLGDREWEQMRGVILSYEKVTIVPERTYDGPDHDHQDACGCGHDHHTHGHHDHQDACDQKGAFGKVASCGCGHDHGVIREKGAGKLRPWMPLIGGVVFFAAGWLMPWDWGKLVFFLLSVGVSGYRAFFNAFSGLFHRRIDENLLMCIAVLAAFVIGIWTKSAQEFSEGAMVTLLFVLGEHLEGLAVSRSQRQIEALTEILPEEARLLTQEGDERQVPAVQLETGDLIRIRPGERVPADCMVQEGKCLVDTSVVTGESDPRQVEEGGELLSGTVNLDGLLTCRVLRPSQQSAAARILEMVEDSAKQKGVTERFITRFARVYTPAVLVVALAIAFLPPALSLGDLVDWVERSLVFLVASCPCALVISVPLSFFSAIGAASKQGVLVKGGKFIELLARVRHVAFDKTGTLTLGKPRLREIHCYGALGKQEALSLAALAESHSNHPIAVAITQSCSAPLSLEVEEMREHSGYGLELHAGGRHILCGNEKMMTRFGVDTGFAQGEAVLLAVDGKLEAGFVLEDSTREDAGETISALKRLGVEKIQLVSGDLSPACRRVAKESGISHFFSECLPEDKVERVKELRGTGVTLFVGDGINDAPVLAAADVGVAMGFGAQAATQAADVVLMSGQLASLPGAISLCRRSMGVIRFNVAFALAVKLGVLLLALSGYGAMWMAVFADVGVSILAVLNASRILLFSSRVK